MKQTLLTRGIVAAAVIGMFGIVAPALAQQTHNQSSSVAQVQTAQMTSPEPSPSGKPCQQGQSNMDRSSTGDKPIQGVGSASNTPSGPTSTTGVSEPTSPQTMAAKQNPCPSPSGSASPEPSSQP